MFYDAPAFPSFRGFCLRHSLLRGILPPAFPLAGILPPAFPLAGDFASGIPHSGGLGLCHSPLRGIWPQAFPTPLPQGPLQQQEKSSKSAYPALFVFFVLRPFAYKSKLLTLGPSTKKALKRCLRAFFRCCGGRGIRTPGTVTRTSV